MLPLSFDDLWGQLQQPVKPTGMDHHFRLLLAALDCGWRIEEPVYLRPRWGSSGARVYHFVLHRDGDMPRLITVDESAAVAAYVRAEGLQVRG
jgi:hypothetical protein